MIVLAELVRGVSLHLPQTVTDTDMSDLKE